MSAGFGRAIFPPPLTKMLTPSNVSETIILAMLDASSAKTPVHCQAVTGVPLPQQSQRSQQSRQPEFVPIEELPVGNIRLAEGSSQAAISPIQVIILISEGVTKSVAKRKSRFRGSYNSLILLAPQVGLEPTTLRLTAECSAIELLRSKAFKTRARRY